MKTIRWSFFLFVIGLSLFIQEREGLCSPDVTAAARDLIKKTQAEMEQQSAAPPPSSIDALSETRAEMETAGISLQPSLHPDVFATTDIISETRAEMEASLIPWRTSSFTIIAQNRPINDLLNDFGGQQGLHVHVSPSVQGEISGSFVNQSPAAFLAQMSRAYGLSWFYVNSLLYVGSNQEVNLLVKPLRYVKADAALEMLRTSGFVSSDGRVEKIKDSGMVTISGIPTYIELTTQLLNSVDTETQFHDNGETVIEVFPLNNAWAYDVNIGGGVATIQGVASTLRQLIWGYGGGGVGRTGGFGSGAGASVNGALNKNGIPNQMAVPNQSTGVLPPTSQQVPPGYPGNAPAMANSGARAPSVANSGTPDLPPATDSPNLPTSPSGGPGSDWTYAMITADVRRNAVVIRDIRANMPLYEAAIRKLDVPVRVVEIAAAIVDLKLGASRTLGLNSFGVNASSFNVGGTNGTIGIAGQSAPNAISPNLNVGGVFGTTSITTAINALSGDHKAKVLSRPTILTLDNFGACITNQDTFYVNSVGQYVSNLYNVNSGLSLQVVPHITLSHGETRIYLQVQIQDGKQMPGGPGELPQVEQSSITTQSVIKEDQSLLIGGLYRKVTDKEASGYPWLYKIPVVGSLFGVKSSSKEMVERVFLITPRIIEVNSKNLGDYSEYFKPAPLVEDAINVEKSGAALPTAEIESIASKGWSTGSSKATLMTSSSSKSTTNNSHRSESGSGKNSTKKNTNGTAPSKKILQQQPAPTSTSTPKPKRQKELPYDPPLKVPKEQLGTED